MPRGASSLAFVILIPLCASGAAEDKRIAAPDDKTFVIDQAAMISKSDAVKIDAAGKKLLADTQVHLVVLTVKSMHDFGTETNIEAFAKKFLSDWSAAQPDKAWAKSALLVRAAGEHKVHIQLGDAWGHSQDKGCQELMTGVIAPKFMANDPSGGFADGAAALASLLTKNIAASKSK